ncbi:hypothetical protein V8G54_002904 [Vigna mungo]|uniref:Agenet domain-containing protein n=1 Tax=Vigna mungo TaxID=3915 RepID=A0AAQ3P9K6_VIGMU
MRPPRKKVNFRPGDKVEVSSNEEGFFGLYVVRYDTLLEDDESKPLTLTVFPRELRPKPPRIATSSSFALYQRVDAFDNDGWWVGEITGKVDIDRYYVYFSTTHEEIVYPASAIRVHQEWINGQWIRSN